MHSDGGGVPELANAVTLLARAFEGQRWAAALQHYENAVFSGLLVVVLLVVAGIATRRLQWIPSGLQNAVEAICEGLNAFICNVIGPAGRHFTPFIGTLFLYILLMNWMALVPGLKSPTSSLNTTVALAIAVFGYVQYTALRRLGLRRFLAHLLGNPERPEGLSTAGFLCLLPLLVVVHAILFTIHVLEEFIKPLSLSLRLFGNVTGEDVLLALFVGLGIASLAALHSPVGLPLQLPAMGLALLLGTVQALVFTLLSTIYIAMVLPHEPEAHH